VEPVVAAHVNADSDQLLDRYELPPGYARFTVGIGQVDATAGTAGLGPVYLLVAAYAARGRTKEAAGVVQKLISDHDGNIAPFPLIILCELYQKLGDWDEIIHLVAHFEITNTDDAGLVLRTYQAMAMANQSLDDAALEVLKDCLRSTKRNPGLLHAARYTRAQIYLKTGKKALAKRDFSRIYADDPDYLDTQAQLDRLA
jgi:tetratricopeptide (TPR) repeat protein